MTRSHQEMELDLPFLVNGTLDAAERVELEALLEGDELLAAEHDALTAIRTGMQAEEIRTPGEFGLARLMRDVSRDDTREGARDRTHHETASHRRHVLARLAGRSQMWQAVAAVAVIGFLAQGYFLRPPANVEINVSPAGYVLAGAEAPGALIVGFAPGATEATIRGLLLEAELEIVAGPSALGLYRLNVLAGADLGAAAETLRAARAIVESVENAQN